MMELFTLGGGHYTETDIKEAYFITRKLYRFLVCEETLPEERLRRLGDLKFSVDFRQVYATLLERWLGAAPEAVLGQQFTTLTFI